MVFTPLHQAAKYGDLAAVRELLSCGADANSADQAGWTPLHWASSAGHSQVAALLVGAGADVNARTQWEATPLHMVGGQSRHEVAELLLQSGAIIDACNSNGWTPLHKASYQRGFGLVAALLLRRVANIATLTHSGCSALDYAKEHGNCDVVTFLLQRSANDSNMLHAEGEQRIKARHVGTPAPPPPMAASQADQRRNPASSTVASSAQQCQDWVMTASAESEPLRQLLERVSLVGQGVAAREHLCLNQAAALAAVYKLMQGPGAQLSSADAAHVQLTSTSRAAADAFHVVEERLCQLLAFSLDGGPVQQAIVRRRDAALRQLCATAGELRQRAAASVAIAHTVGQYQQELLPQLQAQLDAARVALAAAFAQQGPQLEEPQADPDATMQPADEQHASGPAPDTPVRAAASTSAAAQPDIAQATAEVLSRQLRACGGILAEAAQSTRAAAQQLLEALQEEAAALQHVVLSGAAAMDGLEKLQQLVTSWQGKDSRQELLNAHALSRYWAEKADLYKEVVALKALATQAACARRENAAHQITHKKRVIQLQAEVQMLQLEGNQAAAAKAQESIAALQQRLLELGEAAKEMERRLANPQLAKYYPELADAQIICQLRDYGAAAPLVDHFIKLDMFRRVRAHAACVDEVVDAQGATWALKRLVGDTREVVAEAEKMHRLGGHPLVVPLRAIFYDQDVTYLQMPLYRRGNLRAWFEEVKGMRAQSGTLSAAAKAEVQHRMRQLAQALAYMHQKGIVHRDVKPENVLLHDNGNIALCDFGASKDLLAGRFMSTVMLGQPGTAAYSAPEAATPAWREHPTAVDAWSFGVMLLELVSGQLPPAGAPLPAKAAAVPAGDAWFERCWALIQQLLAPDAAARPSMDAVLLADLFTARPAAAESKYNVLQAHLDAVRRSTGRAPARIAHVRSWDTVAADLLAAFGDAAAPLQQLLAVQFGDAGVRKPLAEVMDQFWAQLAVAASSPVLEQCEQPWSPQRAYHLCADGDMTRAKEGLCEALGRLMAKCLLEGLHIPLNLSIAVHSYLLGDAQLSSDTATCLGMLAAFDPEAAHRAQQMLRDTHGSGGIGVTLGMLTGTEDDETPVTDANKHEAARALARHRLIASRQCALDALQRGFGSLRAADHLQLFTPDELAAACFGNSFIDVDAVLRALQPEQGGRQAAAATAWLRGFVAGLSETNLRVFLSRATNSLLAPPPSARITCALHPDDMPAFVPDARLILLPACASAAVLAARMAVALRLGEYVTRTSFQEQQRLSRAEEEAIIRAMQEGSDRNNRVRLGGWKRCPNGHLYAIAACGGAMEEAVCPVDGCGARIGGGQHRLRGDNDNALDFDGAGQPAWGQL